MAHLYRVYLYWWNTGHRYVGKTYQGSKRIGRKIQYKYCARVYRHWNKHGDPDIIQLLEDNIPSDKISEREQYWIKEYDAYIGNNYEFGLNLTTGGEHCELSEETKRRCSESKKGKKPYEMTDEIRKHMSIGKMGSVPWNKGKPWDEEFVKEMSKRQVELMKNEKFKERCLTGLKKYHKEHPEACRQTAKEFMGKQENRDLVSKLTKEAMWRPDVREKYLKGLEKIRQDPAYQKKMKENGIKQRARLTKWYEEHPEARQEISNSLKQHYIDNPEAREEQGKHTKDTIWINDGEHNKRIKEQDLVKYPNWKIGRFIKPGAKEKMLSGLKYKNKN